MNLQSEYSKDNLIHTHSMFQVIWKNAIHDYIVEPCIFNIYILHHPSAMDNDNRTTLAFTLKALLTTSAP